MDVEAFLQACFSRLSGEGVSRGIGTLGEKILHSVLKLYFEPCEDWHERKVGSFVADIQRGQSIVEIQTRNFDKLRMKLQAFLPEYEVTLVYPVPALKWLIWVDENGQPEKRRKSPRRGKPWDIFPELYKIKPWLSHENLRLCIVLLELEEYRLKNGWSADGKKGSTRFNRVPIALLNEVNIEDLSGYQKLMPEGLEEGFTVKDFQKAAGLSPKAASTAVNVLYSLGTVKRTGKQGRAFVYSRA